MLQDPPTTTTSAGEPGSPPLSPELRAVRREAEAQKPPFVSQEEDTDNDDDDDDDRARPVVARNVSEYTSRSEESKKTIINVSKSEIAAAAATTPTTSTRREKSSPPTKKRATRDAVAPPKSYNPEAAALKKKQAEEPALLERKPSPTTSSPAPPSAVTPSKAPGKAEDDWGEKQDDVSLSTMVNEMLGSNNHGTSQATSDLLWGTEEEANPYRDEIVRTIFGDVGAIRRDFSCAIERKILLHGRLYVTDRFICFYSNLFGFEKKIKIPYSYITCITKEYTAVFIPNAIAVITARREYIFRSFWDRDECYAVLKSMHDMYRGVVETGPGAHIEEGGAMSASSILAGVTPATTNGKGPATTQQRHMDLDAIENDATTVPGGGKGNKIVKKKLNGPLLGQSPEENLEDNDAGGELATDLQPALARRSDQSINDFGQEAAKRQRSALRQPPAAAASAPLVAPPPRAKTTLTPVAESAGSIISLGNISALGALAHELTSTILPVTIDKFFAHFLADNAGYSLPKFHEFQRDGEVQSTPWVAVPSQTPEARDSEQTRIVRFRRKLRSPIGPASTRTTKMQRCRIFGRRGIVVNTVMTMEDIPYRDCFTVEDRWVAEPTDDKRQTRVRFEFQVVWTKTTIWKRRIETSSKADLEGFYESYVQGAHAYLDTLTEADRVSLREEPILGRAGVGDDVGGGGPSDDDDDDDAKKHKTKKDAGALAIITEKNAPGTDSLIKTVFLNYRVSWLLALFILLFIKLIKQHNALVNSSRLQQQLINEIADLRKELQSRRSNGRGT